MLRTSSFVLKLLYLRTENMQKIVSHPLHWARLFDIRMCQILYMYSVTESLLLEASKTHFSHFFVGFTDSDSVTAWVRGNALH